MSNNKHIATTFIALGNFASHLSYDPCDKHDIRQMARFPDPKMGGRDFAFQEKIQQDPQEALPKAAIAGRHFLPWHDRRALLLGEYVLVYH